MRARAEAQINHYWRSRGWQLILGEAVLFAAAVYQHVPYPYAYGVLAGAVAFLYGLGFFPRLTFVWLGVWPIVFLMRALMINGLGAVTALSFLVPYSFAAMLRGQKRVFVQTWCVAAFWISLIYEVVPNMPHFIPSSSILVGYNILLAAFTFQTLLFVRQLAVEVNTTYAAEQVRAQSQHFLARVSHELRTPLNSVLGFAKLLRRADLSETQRGYLAHIIEESEQLNRLVSDLLDSAHLSTGKLKLNLEAVDVNAICQVVADEHRPALSPTVTLQTEFAPGLPPIKADPVRLRQSVGNLVSNAIKYTERGEITLRTCQQDSALHIEVTDTGIGIPEDQQGLIFVPFVQLDSRRLGVGLGLDIALQLVRLHGGDIRLQSTPGLGSTFTIVLPAEA